MPDEYYPGTLRLAVHWIAAVLLLLPFIAAAIECLLDADKYWGEGRRWVLRKIYIAACLVYFSPLLYFIFLALWIAGLITHAVWPLTNGVATALLVPLIGVSAALFISLPVFFIAKLFKGFGEAPTPSRIRSFFTYLIIPPIFFLSSLLFSLTATFSVYPARLLSGEAIMQASAGPAGLFFDTTVANIGVFITPPDYNDSHNAGEEMLLTPREVHMFFVFMAQAEKVKFMRAVLIKSQEPSSE